MNLFRYDSISSLLADADRWDALWLSSEETLPTLTAAPLAHHLATLAKRRPFALLGVEHEGELIAALPLLGETRGRVLSLGALPNGGWGGYGDLMVHPDHTSDPEVYARLLSEIKKLRWPLLSLRGVDASTEIWQLFEDMVIGAGLAVNVSTICAIGQIEIAGNWDAYTAAWSRNHRGAINKSLRKAGEGLSLRRERNMKPAALNRAFAQFAAVEDLSWKGEAGTSLLKSGMSAYFLQQAALLNDRGCIELAFLDLHGKTIAAEFSYLGKGVYHAFKIGYDPAYRQLGPGQLLHRLLLEELFREEEFHRVNTMGPLSEATARWCTHKTFVHDMTMATRPRNNLLARAYRQYWPEVKRIFRDDRKEKWSRCGAEDYLHLRRQMEQPVMKVHTG